MTGDQINSYIGLPWVAGGRGPAAFDCYGLMRHIQSQHFGLALPDVTLGADGTAAQTFAAEMTSGHWQRLAGPVDGAGVLLRGGTMPHVGTWLANDGGGVLHALEGSGVWFHSREVLRSLGFGRMQFYRFGGAA